MVANFLDIHLYKAFSNVYLGLIKTIERVNDALPCTVVLETCSLMVNCVLQELVAFSEKHDIQLLTHADPKGTAWTRF